MFPIDGLSEIKKLAESCVKCGLCQAVCPVYTVEGGEQSCARGKTALMRKAAEGELDLDRYVIDALSRCVGCSSCQAVCRNGVEFIRMLAAARKTIREQERCPRNFRWSPLVKKLALGIFAERDEAEEIATYGSLFNKVVRGGRLSGKGLELKFPIPGIGKGAYVPPMAERSFIEKEGGIHKAENEWTRVAFFVGCSSSLILPEIGEAILSFLLKNGVTIVIPPEQVCCGTPHYISGDPDTSNRLLALNEEEFANRGFDSVITGCATCGGGLKEFYSLRNNKGESVPVYDFNEFIVEHKDRFKIDPSKIQGKITWHDPCHLARLQNIKEQPRELLIASAGGNFIEMERPDSCCGFGGVFAAAEPKIAIETAKVKAERIRESEAVTVVTSCPGCVLFLRMGKTLSGGDWEVIHIAELLGS